MTISCQKSLQKDEGGGGGGLGYCMVSIICYSMIEYML